MEKFESVFELISTLEEDIETSLTKNIKEWVAFHAGCVAIKDISCMIVGGPDTGKTTTTFQLIEMGNSHLCEEVTPVDPETMMVHPFPLVLSMSGHYVEEFQSLFPIKEGIVNLIGSQIARYSPYKVLKKPASLKMIIIPAYNLSFLPKIIELSPGKVLTELLQYCFPPNIGEERLFDNVIRIAEKCLILRIHTNGIKQTRNLLEKIIDKYSFPF